ncbi:hypothetical protein BBJ28_00020495 [Nothophytophthora sp. Chile5]|nr:hypothetical protein BBJ28_00020495 [Nothophytophthora sp. Chile5]
MKAFLSCNWSITRTRTPAHFVDANEFLFIAAETYHKSSTPFPGAGLDHCEEVGGSSPTGQAVTPQTFARLQAVPGQISATGGRHSLEAAVETASSTGAVVLEGIEDEDDAQLQTRLGSLLERMKKRQESTGL